MRAAVLVLVAASGVAVGAARTVWASSDGVTSFVGTSFGFDGAALGWVLAGAALVVVGVATYLIARRRRP